VGIVSFFSPYSILMLCLEPFVWSVDFPWRFSLKLGLNSLILHAPIHAPEDQSSLWIVPRTGEAIGFAAAAFWLCLIALVHQW
jgi:hypothetical protein